jgi:hypothetical protein
MDIPKNTKRIFAALWKMGRKSGQKGKRTKERHHQLVGHQKVGQGMNDLLFDL